MTTPKTRIEYWERKFRSNLERDARKERELVACGWDVLIIWECETFDRSALASRLQVFLTRSK